MSSKARCSLADHLPSSKKLGKTIIIPQVAYDFGGIIPSSKVMESSHTFESSNASFKGWKQLQGLLGES